MSLLMHKSEKESQAIGDTITVAHLREWLAALPEEFQKAELESCRGGLPLTLKRIVAYRSKDGSCIGVCANSVGSHLPFDDSLTWEHVLT